MKVLSTTRRQLKRAVGVLGLSAIAFVVVPSSIAHFRKCPTYPATVTNTTNENTAEKKTTKGKSTTPSDNPNQLSLLLYNLRLRPRLLFATSQNDRIQNLFSLIKGYDIVVLTEAFDDYALNELKSRYPAAHVSTPLGQNEGFSQDSGLSILSQWPFILKSQHQKVFDSDCTGTSCFNYQGIIAVAIQKEKSQQEKSQQEKSLQEKSPKEEDRVYHVLAAQLQAGNSQKAQSIRRHQYQQIRQFIDVIDIPENEPIIFAASLPISPQTHADEYQQMIEAIGLIPSNIAGERQYSLDATDNNLVQSAIPQTPDALFTLAQSAQQPQSAMLQIRPMRTSLANGWRSSRLLAWQCPQQNLSDHHAVEGQFMYESPAP